MNLLDHIREVQAIRPAPRSGDVISAYLHSYDDGTAVVSFYGDERHTVRATPGLYDGIRTVHLQVDASLRPVLVLGPTTAGSVPDPEPEPEPSPVSSGGTSSGGSEPAARRLITRMATIRPSWSGTYSYQHGSYGSYGRSTPGYPNTLMQGAYNGSGNLVGLAAYGSQISGLDAVTLTAKLTVKSAHWTSFVPLVQPASHSGKPSGAPNPSGDTLNMGAISAGGTRTRDLPDSVCGRLRTGTSKSLALVGSTHGAVRGRDSAMGMSLSITYQVYDS